jgi:1,4-alpha-glucan branching enzyme
MKRILLFLTFLAMMPLFNSAQLKFTFIDPANNTIKIKNFGASAVDISSYRLCALFEYTSLVQPNVSLVAGDFNLSQNEEVTFTWNSGSGFNTTASDVGLFLPTGAFTSAANMLDFVQYGAGGQGRENVAASGGYWTAGTFLTGTGPWYYIGNGSASGLSQWSNSLPVSVTFQVDMSQQTVNANGVHIAGSFQGWNASSSEMTDVDADGIYEFTEVLDGSSTIQYKFINGNSFSGVEVVPVICGVNDGFGGYNRSLTLGTSDIIVDAVCFGECTACELIVEPLTVEITFQVNMQNQTVSPNGVHVAGSFQGWNAGSSEMTDVDLDGVYEFTAAIDTNSTIQYVFINGNTFGGQELIPGTCGVDNGFGGFNRTYEVLETNAIIDAVCFGACVDCEPIVEPLTVDVTFQVNMQDQTVSANGVHLAGNFQGWDAASTEMTDVDLNGIYEVTVAIDTNSTILYNFINGDTFGEQESVPSTCGADNGFGGFNRTYEVLETNAIIDAVCFGGCVDCEPIVEPLTVDVTFQVNMQDQTVSANGVHLAGNFQGWDAASTEMTDVDMDGIYEVTVAIDTNSTILYNFINGDTFGEQESVPSICGVDNGFGGFNRTYEVLETNAIIDAVCFGACVDCEPIVEPLTVDITFQVNMQDQTVSANGVHLAGNFQGWDAASTEMTDVDLDGIYEVTVAIDTNSTILYNFINGDTFGEQESVPSICGVDNGFGGFNRTYEVLETNAIIDAVCFGACVDCEPIVEPLTVDVTFQVNMQDQTVSANGVHLAGNFQGWDAASTEMTDVDMDGIYEVTVAIDTNSTILYNFINGDTFGEQESVPSICGVDNGFGGFNRTYEVLETNAIIDAVCFGACVDCELIVEPLTVEVTFLVDMNNSIISPNGVHIAGSFQNWDAAASPMIDSNLDGVYEFTASIDTNSVVQYVFINGNTFDDKEIVPSECGVDDGFGQFNREIEVMESDITLNSVCFSSCTECIIIVPTSIFVTVSVNMQGQSIDPAGVHVLGNFNGTEALYVLSDLNGDLIFEGDIISDPNADIDYVFVNGNTFAGEEVVPAECSIINPMSYERRSLQTGVVDIVLETVCFGSCENCPVPSNMITLMVNMMNETVSPNGVHVAGNFQDWDPATSELTDANSDGIYEITFETDEWANLSFKFINGNTWGDAEVVPSTCGLPDGNGGFNRILETGGIDVNFGPVCFGECIDCEGSIQMVDVTLLVNMNDEVVDANGVHVAGSFQSWNPATTEMTDTDVDGIYEFTMQMQAGTTIQFRFINGNDWPFSETVPFACGTDDGFGGYNRSIAIGTSNFVYGPICFGACVNCEDIVEPTTVDVLFSVNMQNEIVDANGVHIAGNFQNWNPATTQMTDTDLDGIYEITLPVPINSTAEFRFINGNDWPFSEAVPVDCGIDDGFGGLNRSLDVLEANLSYGPVCFGECADCAASVPVLVIFQVDMSNETVSVDGVFIAGTFNNWDETATQLTEFEPNHFQAVVVLNAGQTVQYKFLNGMDWAGSETVPTECAVSVDANREFTAGTEGITLDLVCFSGCSACELIELVDITFTVDMSQQTVANGVYLAGSFNGFSANATPMTNTSANFYSATISIPTNTAVTYKFLNGPDFAGVETVPFECGVNDGFGGFNRTFTSDAVNVTLPTVCFSSCVACPVSVSEITENSFVIYPNPADEFFTIQQAEGATHGVFIYDATGKCVMNQTITGNVGVRFETETWSSGLYQIVIPGVGKQSLIVR